MPVRVVCASSPGTPSPRPPFVVFAVVVSDPPFLFFTAVDA